MKKTIYIPDDLYRKVEELSRKEGGSISSTVCKALRLFLEQRTKGDGKKQWDTMSKEERDLHLLRKRVLWLIEVKGKKGEEPVVTDWDLYVRMLVPPALDPYARRENAKVMLRKLVKRYPEEFELREGKEGLFLVMKQAVQNLVASSGGG